MSLTITIVGTEQVAADLRALPAAFAAQLRPTFSQQVIGLQTYVKQQKLEGQVLKTRTRKLHDNINIRERDTADGYEGSVGTNLVYAAIHEYGGTVPAHLVEAKHRFALHWVGKDGRHHFAQSVQIPAVTMPKRSFLRSALDDRRAEIQRAIEAATERVIQRAGGQA